MALPKDEANWDALQLMFATRSGDVRRNALSDFESVRANGKIAMKLEPGDQIVGVMTCTEDDDVLLTSAKGKSIRFPRRRSAHLQGPRVDGRARHQARRR